MSTSTWGSVDTCLGGEYVFFLMFVISFLLFSTVVNHHVDIYVMFWNLVQAW